MKKGHEGQAVVSETSSGSGSGADSVGTRDYGKQPLVCAGCGASGCSRQCRRCNDLLCQDCINGYDICYMCAGAYESTAEGSKQPVLGTSGPVCAHSMDAEGWRARYEVQDVEGLLEESDGVKVVDKESDKQKEEGDQTTTTTPGEHDQDHDDDALYWPHRIRVNDVRKAAGTHMQDVWRPFFE